MLENPKEILENAVALLRAAGLTPVMATEVEFYLKPTSDKKTYEKFKEQCYADFISAGILTLEIQEEKEAGQYEVALLPSEDIAKTAKNTKKLIQIIKNLAKQFDLKAKFSAKPYKNKPGNGLHIHLSLKDNNGANIMAKARDEDETHATKCVIGGLCAIMAESMMFFAPNKSSYKRYNAKFDDNAPVNISWGGNNRTTAIRIPASTVEPAQRHIEHRVAAPDANPYLAMAAILVGAHYGITKNIVAGEKIWGSAYDAQYNLPPLPTSLEEAQKAFKKGKILKKGFGGLGAGIGD